ncbi:hypothetical protein [Acinetobacter sp. YH12153]|uniref:hypothetical protein n=1 Tax=Acinetobacter sp. YH12153 TaxID=2601133 RepID=UPI0015D250F8|nr:hypothetical protein [Acinetobacter sp. YH12153]
MKEKTRETYESLYKIIMNMISGAITLFLGIGVYTLLKQEFSLWSIQGLFLWFLMLLGVLTLYSLVFDFVLLKTWLKHQKQSGLSFKNYLIKEEQHEVILKGKYSVHNVQVYNTAIYLLIMLVICFNPIWTTIIPVYVGAPLLAITIVAGIVWAFIMSVKFKVRKGEKAA